MATMESLMLTEYGGGDQSFSSRRRCWCPEFGEVVGVGEHSRPRFSSSGFWYCYKAAFGVAIAENGRWPAGVCRIWSYAAKKINRFRSTDIKFCTASFSNAARKFWMKLIESLERRYRFLLFRFT